MAEFPGGGLGEAGIEGLQELREAGASDAVTDLLARDPAGSVSLDDPWGIADLLAELRKAAASDAIATLLARDLTAYVRLDSPVGIALLLRELRTAGASDAAAALTARAESAAP